MAFIDVRKAFDTVPIDILFFQLQELRGSDGLCSYCYRDVSYFESLISLTCLCGK